MSNRSHPNWTQERNDQLRELWDQKPKLSASQIGRVMDGLSRSAVLARAGRMGLEKRSCSEKIKEVARERKLRAPPSLPKPPALLRIINGHPEPIGPWCDIPENGCCRYIHGELGQAWRCCGHQTARRDFPWCSFHVKIVYAAQPKRSEAIAA